MRTVVEWTETKETAVANLGINFLFDNYPNPEAAWASVGPFLALANLPAIQVTSGARIEQAFTFAKQLKDRYPAMDVVLRRLPDENPALHKRFPAGAAFAISNAPWSAGGRLLLSLQNEAGVNDLPDQATWFHAVSQALPANGRTVFPSIQTHNRFDPSLLEQTYRDLADAHGYLALHYYWSKDHGIEVDPIHTSVLAYCRSKGIPIKFLITEAAYAENLASKAGANGRLDPRAYADQIEELARKYPDVIFLIYCWGAQAPWQDFDISTNHLVKERIIMINNQAAPVPVPNVPTVPSAPVSKLVLATGLALRIDTNPSAQLVRRLVPGERVSLYTSTQTPVTNGYAWVWLATTDGLKGWAALRGAWGESFRAEATAPAFRLGPVVGCATVISSRFGGPRDYDGDGEDDDKHEGLDLAPAHADCTPVILAGADGVVDAVSTAGDYGNHVKLRHQLPDGSTYVSWYCHMREFSVFVGKTVKRGDVLGVLGSTGNSTGPHLHLNLQWLGHGLPGFVIPDAVDPEPYLRA